MNTSQGCPKRVMQSTIFVDSVRYVGEWKLWMQGHPVIAVEKLMGEDLSLFRKVPLKPHKLQRARPSGTPPLSPSACPLLLAMSTPTPTVPHDPTAPTDTRPKSCSPTVAPPLCTNATTSAATVDALLAPPPCPGEAPDATADDEAEFCDADALDVFVTAWEFDAHPLSDKEYSAVSKHFLQFVVGRSFLPLPRWCFADSPPLVARTRGRWLRVKRATLTRGSIMTLPGTNKDKLYHTHHIWTGPALLLQYLNHMGLQRLPILSYVDR